MPAEVGNIGFLYGYLKTFPEIIRNSVFIAKDKRAIGVLRTGTTFRYMVIFPSEMISLYFFADSRIFRSCVE